MKLLLENWKEFLNEEPLQIPSWAVPIKQQYDAGEKTPQSFRQYAAQIKQAYDKEKDQSFLNNFVYIHFIRKPEWFQNFIAGGVDSSSDLSTMGYPKGTDLQTKRTWGPIGLIISGDVVLAGVGDLQTDLDRPSVRHQKGYKKYTGKPEYLVANAEDFKKSGADMFAEAVVEDWEIVGVVLPQNKIPEGFEELIQEIKLPVYDSTLKKIPLETLKL